MGHDTELLMSIVMALVAAFAGGLIARRLKLPTIVGYLFGGIVVGPFSPGYTGDSNSLQQLAELGVMFMMFGVGLHFSFKDLWNVRKVAVPGELIQLALVMLGGFLLGRLWGWSTSASLVLGISISIASTVVLIRNLTNEGLFNTSGGQVATGRVIIEDIVTIVILVILPVVFGSGEVSPSSLAAGIGLALIKTTAFAAIMIFFGSKIMPRILTRIARFQSSELFLLAVLVLALGTAVGAAELFGVSIALGAFLAGVVIKGSGVSHQVAAKAIPFQDLFSILFFVSVGMMLNPLMLVQNLPQVIILTLVIVVGKWLINLLLGLILPSCANTALTVAAGLSQIGEFSFIVCQSALVLGVLGVDQYGLILAGSALSIAFNPLVFKTIKPIENWMKSKPRIWNLSHWQNEPMKIEPSLYSDHVIVIGFGRSGKYTARILKELEVPYLVIEKDMKLAEKANEADLPVLYGDAANSSILEFAGLERASVLVVTGAQQSESELIVISAREQMPDLKIIARASTEDGIERLVEAGANSVIHPELEGGLELMRYTLLDLGFASSQIQQYVDAVRENAYSALYEQTGNQPQALDQLITSIQGVTVRWGEVEAGSSVAGKTIADTNLRARTGATIAALMQDDQVIANPDPALIIQPGTLLALIGGTQDIERAIGMITAIKEASEKDAEAGETDLERLARAEEELDLDDESPVHIL